MIGINIEFCKLISIGLSVFILGCSQPEVRIADDAEVSEDGLYKVEHARVDEAWVKPGVDWLSYKKLWVEPLDTFTVQIDQPNVSGITRFREWQLTDEDKLLLQRLYRESMDRHLMEKGGFTLVNSTGEGVLLIKSKLVELAPTGPKDDAKSRSVSRSTIVTRGAGSITAVWHLYDAHSDELLAKIIDKRKAPDIWRKNNRFNNIAETRRVFNGWASQFAGRMNSLSM